MGPWLRAGLSVSAVLPPAPDIGEAVIAPARLHEVDDRSVPIHHLLDLLAGYLATPEEAREVMRQLEDDHGLLREQLTLLCPADGARLRFWGVSRRWKGRPGSESDTRRGQIGPVALAGAMLSAAVTLGVLATQELAQFESALEFFDAVWVALALSAALGGAACAGLAALRHRRQPRVMDFERAVRHKLETGHWVVVVRDVPWSEQAGVLALVRRLSPKWSAVSSGRRSR